MSIDPNDLGPPVYKYEQVLTEDDVSKWASLFERVEVRFALEGNNQGAGVACYIHRLFEDMITWIDEGKPSLDEWEHFQHFEQSGGCDE